MRRSILLVLIVATIATGRTNGAHQATRDGSPTGTAVIAGRVVEADAAAQPVRRALVTVRGDTLASPLLTTSDDDGRFVVDRLPAGTYRLSAEHRGFVAGNVGERRPGGKGAPVVIAAGARQEVIVRLTRHAVVSGTVRGPTMPLPAGARVRAMRRVTIDGGLRTIPAPARGGEVDSGGEYRLYGLAPGEYVLAVESRFDPILIDEEQAGRQILGFVTVYFPGTTELDRASEVAVSAGEERVGVDIAAQPVRLANLVATIPPGGTTAGSGPFVQLVPTFGDPAQPKPGFFQPDTGHFVASLLPPGRYVLVAGMTRGHVSGSERRSRTAQEVIVDGRDIQLSVSLEPGVVLSGRVVFDGDAPRPESGDTLGVRLQPVHVAKDAIGVSRVMLLADGRFNSEAMIAGRHRFVLDSSPTLRWTLAAATLDGRDILDGMLDMPQRDIDGAVLTFTDRPSRLSGTLTDAAGRGASDYAVLVFSTDPRLWPAVSRRVRHTMTDGTGAFAFEDIAPGEYFLCVLPEVDEGLGTDHAALSALASSAVRVTVAAKEHRVQHLRVSGG
jgi:hypothetical protein